MKVSNPRNTVNTHPVGSHNAPLLLRERSREKTITPKTEAATFPEEAVKPRVLYLGKRHYLGMWLQRAVKSSWKCIFVLFVFRSKSKRRCLQLRHEPLEQVIPLPKKTLIHFQTYTKKPLEKKEDMKQCQGMIVDLCSLKMLFGKGVCMSICFYLIVFKQECFFTLQSCIIYVWGFPL